MPRQTYTAGEAARRLGISIDTLRRWDRQGRIRTRRDTANRRVVSASETSSDGQFTFAGVAKSSYLVELVSDNGKVLAVGPAFRLEPGQTVSTVVRLPTRRSWYAGMFSNAAAVVIAAASSVGLTAVGTHGPPISPQ